MGPTPTATGHQQQLPRPSRLERTVTESLKQEERDRFILKNRAWKLIRTDFHHTFLAGLSPADWLASPQKPESRVLGFSSEDIRLLEPSPAGREKQKNQ